MLLDSGRSVDDATSKNDWDTLTAALNGWGIIHVMPSTAIASLAPVPPDELFARLASSPEPRLQQAVIPLLLTHPHLAADAEAAIDRLAGTRRDRAMRRFVAAAAMQRMARTRIELQLGAQPLLPPTYVDTLALPPLDHDFGRATLLALSSQEHERYGYEAWGTYRTLLDLFLAESRRGAWGRRAAAD